MLKRFSKSLLLVCLLFLIVVFVAILFKNKTYITQADAGNKLNGWAYSPNAGWISFNCANSGTNGCSNPGVDYGVEINNTTGDFSRYAWSEMFGWIYFGPDGLVASSSAPSAPKTWAKLATTTGAVTGWAKILSADNDGWIKMSDDSVAEWQGKGVKISLTTGDFSGWAWNGDATNVGWISFNSSDCDSDHNGFFDTACFGDNTTTPVVDYKVNYSGLPPVAPTNVAITNQPKSGCFAVKVSWTNNSPNIASSTVERKKTDTGWLPFCSVDGEISSCLKNLATSTTYYFRVKVTDKNGNDSVWTNSGSHSTSYCVPVLSLGASNCDGVNLSWAQEGTGVVNYEIWRKKGSAEFAFASSTASTTFVYTDIDIESGSKYQYKIRAKGQTEDLDLDSNTVSVNPCANIPKWQEVKPK